MMFLIFVIFVAIYYLSIFKGSEISQEKLRLCLKAESAAKAISYIAKARSRYLIHLRIITIFHSNSIKIQRRINYEAMISTYSVYFYSLYGDFEAASKTISTIEWDKVTEQYIFSKDLAHCVNGYLHGDLETALETASLMAEKVRRYFENAGKSHSPSVIKKYYNFYDSYLYIGNLLLGRYDDISIQNLCANYDSYKETDIITALLSAWSLKKYYNDIRCDEKANEASSFIMENTTPRITIY